MPYFTDNQGRRWNTRITPYTMRQVKDFCGVNLGTILQDNMAPLTELLSDVTELCTVLYGICQDQAEEQGVSCADFLDGLMGETIEQAAEAFLEGLRDCFPPTQRAVLHTALIVTRQRNRQMQEKLRELQTTLTFTDSPSRWRVLLTWIRGITRGENWAT